MDMLSAKSLVSAVDFVFVVLIARQVVDLAKKVPQLDGKIPVWLKPVLAFVVALFLVFAQMTGWINDTVFVALGATAAASLVNDTVKRAEK